RLCRRGARLVGRRGPAVIELPDLTEGSLLERQFRDRFEHQDTFLLVLHGAASHGRAASALLDDVLAGFLANRPAGVTWLMGLRNLLVAPLRLRTSPLGCPASSL